jgi:hypothetical protein
MIKPATSRPGVDPRTPSRQEGVLPIKLMTLYGVFYTFKQRFYLKYIYILNKNVKR